MKKIILLKYLFCLLIILSLSTNNFSQENSLEFLKIPVGTKAIALGGAYTSVVDDVYATYWNPAGLCKSFEKQISFTYTSWWEGIYYNYLAYSHNITKNSMLGISIGYLSFGTIEKSAIDFSNPIESPVYSGNYSPFDLVLGVSFANKLEKFLIGDTIKFIYSKIDEHTAYTYALDIGIIYNLSKKESFGFTIKNLGPSIKYIKKYQELPIEFRLGVSYKTFDEKLLISLDFSKQYNKNIIPSIGIEYRSIKLSTVKISPLIGYKVYDNTIKNLSGFSMGVEIKKSNLEIVYGTSIKEELGFIYSITLTIRNLKFSSK